MFFGPDTLTTSGGISRSGAFDEARGRLGRGPARLRGDSRSEDRDRASPPRSPAGARPVSLAKHIASPEGPGAIYLCQHAIRSKATLRHGAAQVAGGFAAWKKAGLPVEEVD